MHSVGACTSSLCVCRKSPQTAANHQNRDLRELRRPQFSPVIICLRKWALIKLYIELIIDIIVNLELWWSSMQGFEGAPCKVLRELRAELCAEHRPELWWNSVQSFEGAPCRALVGLCAGLLRELRAELWWSSLQSFEGVPCRALMELSAELWGSSVQSSEGVPCRALIWRMHKHMESLAPESPKKKTRQKTRDFHTCHYSDCAPNIYMRA